MVECDPDKCSVEKRVEKSDRRAPKRSLWCALRQEWWHSVAHFRVVPERLASVAREPENARLGGWGARIRTWDHGTKARCLTAWPRPNLQLPREIYRRRTPTSIDKTKQSARASGFLRGSPDPSIYGPSQRLRSVAQPGSAPASGAGGREFESPHSDHYFQGLRIWFGPYFARKIDDKLTLSRCRMPLFTSKR